MKLSRALFCINLLVGCLLIFGFNLEAQAKADVSAFGMSYASYQDAVASQYLAPVSAVMPDRPSYAVPAAFLSTKERSASLQPVTKINSPHGQMTKAGYKDRPGWLYRRNL